MIQLDIKEKDLKTASAIVAAIKEHGIKAVELELDHLIEIYASQELIESPQSPDKDPLSSSEVPLPTLSNICHRLEILEEEMQADRQIQQILSSIAQFHGALQRTISILDSADIEKKTSHSEGT